MIVPEDLPPRQCELVRHLWAGRSTTEIAVLMRIRENTLRQYCCQVAAQLPAGTQSPIQRILRWRAALLEDHITKMGLKPPTVSRTLASDATIPCEPPR